MNAAAEISFRNYEYFLFLVQIFSERCNKNIQVILNNANIKISKNHIANRMRRQFDATGIRFRYVMSRLELRIQPNYWLSYWLSLLIKLLIKPAINKQVNIKLHWTIISIKPCSFVVFIVYYLKWMLWTCSCVMAGRYLNNERCYWF